MNHDHDLERLITGSLDARADETRGARRSLDDVHRRVDLRRGRRRHVAVVGATAMLAVGAFALTAVGSSDPTVTPLDGPDAEQPTLQPVWRCTGRLDVVDGTDAEFFTDCQATAVDGNGAVISVPMTTVELSPDTTTVCDVAPTTTPGGMTTSVPSDVVGTTVPCDWGPPPTTPDCSKMSVPADVTVPCATNPTEEFVHLVEAGETLASISDAYGIPIADIVALNAWGGRSDVTLVEGETIVIALMPVSPTSTEVMATTTTNFDERFSGEQEHTIQSGDSLASIAALYGITLEQLVDYNQFADGTDHPLLPGERLLVPPGALSR